MYVRSQASEIDWKGRNVITKRSNKGPIDKLLFTTNGSIHKETITYRVGNYLTKTNIIYLTEASD